MTTVDVSWGALLIAAVVNMVLGYIWYSPMVFGKSWMAEMGNKGEMKPDPAKMLGMLVIAVAIGFILTHFMVYAGASDFGGGVQTGIWAALGLTVLPMASGMLASNTSTKLWMINSGYWIVSLGVMGGIIASMR